MFIQGESQDDSNSDDEEAPQISKWESISWLSILTIWISVLSEYLVNAIEVNTCLQSLYSSSFTNLLWFYLVHCIHVL